MIQRRRVIGSHFALYITGPLIALASCQSKSAETSDAAARAEAAASGAAKSAPVNRVQLSEAAAEAAHVETATAIASPANPTGLLDVPGQVVLDSTRIAIASPRAAGRLERIDVSPGVQVHEGEPIAWLTSPQFLSGESDFVQATRRARSLAGTPDADGAAAIAGAARRRLLLLGASEGAITELAQGAEPSLTLTIPAPRTGSVLAVHALPGTEVQPGSPLVTVADLSVVNVLADVPERVMGRLQDGVAARVAFAAFPGQEFRGRFTRFRDALDPTTRTGQAVIAMANASGRLKPGMFGTVRIAVSGAAESGATGTGAPGATVPAIAVLTDGVARVVFVQVAPHTFERREVVVAESPPGSAASPMLLIRQGIRAGEHIVTKGALVLQSELKKAGLREGE